MRIITNEELSAVSGGEYWNYLYPSPEDQWLVVPVVVAVIGAIAAITVAIIDAIDSEPVKTTTTTTTTTTCSQPDPATDYQECWVSGKVVTTTTTSGNP